MSLEGFKIKSVFNAAANFVRKHEPAFATATSAFFLNEAGIPLEGIVVGTLAMCALSSAAVAARSKNVKTLTP